MARKKATPAVDTPVDLEAQASDAGTTPEAISAAVHAKALAVLATESGGVDPRAGKLYSDAELDVLLRLATSLLGQQTYGTHPDAVLSRARDAFCNAEAILPIYRDLADKDA